MKTPRFLEIDDVAGSKEDPSILRTPSGIAWHNQKLYICDNGNKRMCEFDMKTGKVRPIITGQENCFTPYELDVDKSGILYISDMHNSRIVSIELRTKTFNIIAGSTKGLTDGSFSFAQFSSPRGLAVDGKGNIYVCDGGNNCIRKMDLKTQIVTTIAGKRQAGNDDGPCSSATFHIPSGVRLDSKGNLYVTDTCNNSVRYIDLTNNMVSTIATDLKLPVGLSIWGNGIYICDKWNHRIVFYDTVTKEGAVLFQNQSYSKQDLLDRSSVLFCDFNKPSSLAFDFYGHLFISDRYNHIIRRAIRKKILPWNCEKVLWIGLMKNTGQTCPIARLPKDVLKEIVRHANKSD